MRKFRNYLSISALAVLVMFASCKKEEEETDPTFDCSAQTFPETTGSVDVDILNYTNIVGDFTEIDAAAGDVLSLAMQLSKTTGLRPQKLRLYGTDCENYKGDIVSLAGQEGAEDNDTRLDLRNADSQVRTVLFTVPSGYSTYYLNIEVDESSSEYSYKRIKLNISGSGIVDEYTGKLLGAQSTTEPSRMISGTGQTFTVCDAAASINLVDITYANGNNDTKHYLGSNSSRFDSNSPFYVGSATTFTCGEDGDLTIGPGTNTYFKAATATDYDNATDAILSAVDFTSVTTQYIEVVLNDVVYFKNAKGKVGVAKVTAVTAPAGTGAGNRTGTVTLSLKVQR